MRAALSILGLVVVLAIVMALMKPQAKLLAPASPSSPASSAPAATEAVRQQVDGALQQAAGQAASALQP